MGELDECDDAEDMYHPVERAAADEECWTATAQRDLPVEGRCAPTRTNEPPSPSIRQFTPKTVNYDDEDDI